MATICSRLALPEITSALIAKMARSSAAAVQILFREALVIYVSFNGGLVKGMQVDVVFLRQHPFKHNMGGSLAGIVLTDLNIVTRASFAMVAASVRRTPTSIRYVPQSNGRHVK